MNLWTRRLGLVALTLSAGIVRAQLTNKQNVNAARSYPASWMEVTGTSTSPPVSQTVTGPLQLPGEPKFAPTSPLHGVLAALPPGPRTRTYDDPKYKVSFEYPADWTFTQRDREISTYRLDARSASKKTILRAVVALPSNPYPASTFTGGYVYLSVTPHSSVNRCAAQAAIPGRAKPVVSQIAGLSFAHGHDEQKEICTVERDEIYTTFHKGACYRFDLAMNNFCGGEVSGVKDVTQQELNTVMARLLAVMQTVRFDTN
jgi:hypothetical protein